MPDAASPPAGVADPVAALPVLTIVLCSAIFLLDGVTQNLISPLAPFIAKDLGTGKADLGLVFSAGLVGQSVGLMFISLLPRRIGYRKVIIGCTLAFGLLEAATAMVNSRDQLIALRFLTGIGLGGALPVCLALVFEVTPSERRGMAVMALTSAYSVGAFWAGLLATMLRGGFGWRLGLVLVGLMSLAVGLVSSRGLMESPGYLAGKEADALPRASAANAEAPWRLFAPQMVVGTLLLWLAFSGCLVVTTCITSWLPTLLVDVGRSPSLAALALSAFSSGALLATLILGPLIDRFGATRVLATFFILASPTLFVLGRLIASVSEQGLLALSGLAGFLVLGGYAGVNVLITQYYQDDLRPVGVGWAKCASRLGAVGAPAAVGLALIAGVSEVDLVSITAAPVLIVAIAVVVVGRIIATRRIST